MSACIARCAAASRCCEIWSGVASHGVRAESLLMIGNNLYQKYDSIEKTRNLRRNQRDLAAVGSAAGPAERAEALRG